MNNNQLMFLSIHGHPLCRVLGFEFTIKWVALNNIPSKLDIVVLDKTY